MTALAIFARKRAPWFLTGWLWYLGTLVPVIGIVQVGTQGLADRYTYVPLIGLFLMIAWAMWELPARFEWRAAAANTLAGAALCACTILARRQVGFWQNSATLFRHTVAVAPDSYIAHQVLGMVYA